MTLSIVDTQHDPVDSTFADVLPPEASIDLIVEWTRQLAVEGLQAEVNYSLAVDREDKDGAEHAAERIVEMKRSIDVMLRIQEDLTDVIAAREAQREAAKPQRRLFS
jgi:hypothetical protein